MARTRSELSKIPAEVRRQQLAVAEVMEYSDTEDEDDASTEEEDESLTVPPPPIAPPEGQKKAGDSIPAEEDCHKVLNAIINDTTATVPHAPPEQPEESSPTPPAALKPTATRPPSPDKVPPLPSPKQLPPVDEIRSPPHAPIEQPEPTPPPPAALKPTASRSPSPRKLPPPPSPTKLPPSKEDMSIQEEIQNGWRKKLRKVPRRNKKEHRLNKEEYIDAKLAQHLSQKVRPPRKRKKRVASLESSSSSEGELY